MKSASWFECMRVNVINVNYVILKSAPCYLPRDSRKFVACSRHVSVVVDLRRRHANDVSAHLSLPTKFYSIIIVQARAFCQSGNMPGTVVLCYAYGARRVVADSQCLNCSSRQYIHSTDHVICIATDFSTASLQMARFSEIYLQHRRSQARAFTWLGNLQQAGPGTSEPCPILHIAISFGNQFGNVFPGAWKVASYGKRF